MIFYPNQDTNRFVRSIGLSAEVSAVIFKARDSVTLDMKFHDGLALVALAAESEIVFVIKDGYADDSLTLALADEWTTVAPGHYQATLNLNTEELIAALGDAAKLAAFGELSWNEGVGWESSNTLAVTIENDVYKGTEGTPLSSLNPDEWLEVRRPAPLSLEGPPENGGHLLTVGLTVDGDPLEMTLTRGEELLVIDGKRAWSGVDEEEDSVSWSLAESKWIVLHSLTGSGYESSTDSDWPEGPWTPIEDAEGSPTIDFGGTEAGVLGRLAIVTVGGAEEVWICTRLIPVSWQGPSGLVRDEEGNITIIAGEGGSIDLQGDVKINGVPLPGPVVVSAGVASVEISGVTYYWPASTVPPFA